MGYKKEKVAKKLKSSRTAVHYTKRKQAAHSTTKLLAGRSRKCLFTPHDDHALIRSCVRNCRQTSRGLLARTVGNRLLEAGLKSHRARRKPLIDERLRKAWLFFARDHKDWTVDDWVKDLFSGESNFQNCFYNIKIKNGV
uniref:Transposase Tc1-like domain-containing protein n=1 Tax=Amphiprion percula TaxID=161767 RepID=A0A3P8RUM1_AMPPE